MVADGIVTLVIQIQQDSQDGLNGGSVVYGEHLLFYE